MSEKIRYRKVRDKIRPLCDYLGNCNNLARAEVYPSMLGDNYKDSGWSYLCNRHFKREQKRFGKKLLYWAIPKRASLKISRNTLKY